jgi:type II secretory pathway pseudopilin PulG
MRQRLQNESGFTMITAIITLFIITGLGIGLLQLSDDQQHSAANEQWSESAFNVAEATMNAQIGQLARVWPSKSELAYPTTCSASTTTSSNTCPSTESLEKGYPLGGETKTGCSKGGNEAYGAAKTNEWTSYVRDDGPEGGEKSLIFDSAAAKSWPTWDANGDGKVWVRSVGIFHCRVVSLLSLVSEQKVAVKFPEYAVAGNWFETTNNGNKVIVNTQGKAAAPGGVSMRCSGRTKENCEVYREGQVNPNTTGQPAAPSPTMTATQLEAQAYAAKVEGHYFGPKVCPSNLTELAGLPVYITGPCELSYTGNSVANSITSPGFLIIANGTLTLGGGAEYFGTIYGVNQQESNEAIVHLKGKSKVTGSIIIDGKGGIEFGSSGGKGKGEENENFVYNDKAVKELTTFVGAAGTRNSFRVLPEGQ